MALSTADELRIGELVVRYADAVTRADAVQWAGTWAAESTWHLRTSTVTGRGAIVARWLELLPSSIIQLVTKGWAEETADGARGSWNILEILRRPGADRDCLRVVNYTDRHVREGDRWLFAERRLALHYSQETPAGKFTGWEPIGLDA